MTSAGAGNGHDTQRLPSDPDQRNQDVNSDGVSLEEAHGLWGKAKRGSVRRASIMSNDLESTLAFRAS